MLPRAPIDDDLALQLTSTDPLVLELAKLRWAEVSFEGFVKYLYPRRIIPDFQLEFIRTLDYLERRILIHPVTGRPVYNLLTNFPPRHAKTHYGTILFAAYQMGRKATRKTMVTAYNATLASDFGAETKAVVMSDDFKRVFPAFKLSTDSRANDAFKSTARGAYYAIGLDGPTSGRPANCLIIDDPLKSRPDAESAANRKNVWDFIVSALWLRMEPEEDGTLPIQIMTLTRWHPDDPAGRLMKLPEWEKGEWIHVYHQGLTETSPTDPKGTFDDVSKKYYTALWPERFPVSYMLKQKSRSERDFQAQYQQQPLIEGGNMFKSDWWQTLPMDHDPSVPGQYHSILIAADTAYKQREVNDYSAIAVGGITLKGDIHLLSITRGRWDFPQLKQTLITMNTVWRPLGLRAIIIEDLASGQSLFQELRRESGLSVIARRWPGDKVTHLASILPLAEGGRIFIPHMRSTKMETAWVPEFMTEIEQFPSGAFDDQVDAFTLLVHELARTAITPEMLAAQFEQMNPLNNTPLTQSHALYGKSLANQLGAASRTGWGTLDVG
jgi:predicted phage terminase large subunit-like protein